MPTTLDIFISSKMVELKAERDALYALLPTLDYGDIELHAWVFEEDAPAAEQAIRQIYLKALQNSALYIGLFWNLYGEWTIDEFDRAGDWGIERHIYVKDVKADERVPQLTDFLNKNGDVQHGLTAKWFKTTDELVAAVKNSIENWVVERLRPRSGGSSAILVQDPDDLAERPRKLIGRDELLRRTTELLDKNERVLLTGFGGMGKTALAAEVAAKWLTAGKAPLLWLKTGSSPADALFEALARPFNAAQALAAQSADSRPKFIRTLLRDSGIKLLVLDDCWNGTALFALLKAVPSDLPVLVTARQRYSLDNLLDVGQLAPDDGLTLLLEHSKGDASDDARALCKLLGYHAFALEVAGKTLKARKWTPAHLIAQIKDAPHDLKTPLDFNERERASVKDLLDASLNILDKKSQDLFLAFGAFFAPIVTLDLLQIYKGKNIPIQKALEKLCDHGLVYEIAEEHYTVYTIHDLAYSYAKSQVGVLKRTRALNACEIFVRQTRIRNVVNLAALHPVLSMLVGAVQWGTEANIYQPTIRLVQNLYGGEGILKYVDYSIAARVRELSLTAAQNNHDVDQQARALGDLGHIYTNLADYSKAVSSFERAITIFERLKDWRNEANAHTSLGNTLRMQRNFDLAMHHHHKALTIAHEEKDHRLEMLVLSNIGTLYMEIEDFENSRLYLEQTLEISKKLKDRQMRGNVLNKLISLYSEAGNIEVAANYANLALKDESTLNKRDQLGLAQSLGEFYLISGDLNESEKWFRQALILAQELGHVDHADKILENLNNLFGYHGDK